MTKAKIRQLSLEAGLFTHDKPSYACLATRIPTGTTITPALLQTVEQSEEILFSLGFTDFRIRFFHNAAKIQLPENELALALKKRQTIVQALSPYFEEVLLDLNPRM
nr:hypothetical protein [uncultured Caproiciproducens sp.]